MKKFQIFFMTLLFLTVSMPASAKHILASFFQYTHQVNGNYNVTLTLFRDCTTGTAFDDQLSIGVYDAQTDTLQSNIITNLTATSNVMSGAVCLDKAIYTFTITATTKVNLTWGRCCRNGNLINILNPGDIGMANYATIDPSIVNSSPQYQQYPPFWLGINQPNNINLGVFDADGDSLAYKMATPTSAGTPDIPVLGIGPQLPFDQVVFVNGASASNPLGNDGTWTLDEASGMATIQCSHLGLYAWSLIVEEWRNGAKISQSTYHSTLYILNSNTIANDPQSLSNSSINIVISEANNLVINSIDDKPLDNIVLTNMNGQVVYQQSHITESSFYVPIMSFSKGIYCLQCNRNNQIQTTKILLK